MTRKLLAGTFSAVPIRVHVYPSRGAHMFVGADGGGCWSDPEGKVLLFSMEDVQRVAKAHGYVVDTETNMVLAPAGKPAPGDVSLSCVPHATTDLLDGADAAQPAVSVSPPEGVTIPESQPEPELPADPEGALGVLEKNEGVEENPTPPAAGESFAALEEPERTVEKSPLLAAPYGQDVPAPTPAPVPESTTRAKRSKKGK